MRSFPLPLPQVPLALALTLLPRTPHSFYVGHILIFVYGWVKQANDARLAGLNSLQYSVWISRGAGLCLGVDGLLIVLPGAFISFTSILSSAPSADGALPRTQSSATASASSALSSAGPSRSTRTCGATASSPTRSSSGPSCTRPPTVRPLPSCAGAAARSD